MRLFERGSSDRRWLVLPVTTKDEVQRLLAQLFDAHRQRCELKELKNENEVEDE